MREARKLKGFDGWLARRKARKPEIWLRKIKWHQTARGRRDAQDQMASPFRTICGVVFATTVILAPL